MINRGIGKWMIPRGELIIFVNLVARLACSEALDTNHNIRGWLFLCCSAKPSSCSLLSILVEDFYITRLDKISCYVGVSPRGPSRCAGILWLG